MTTINEIYDLIALKVYKNKCNIIKNILIEKYPNHTFVLLFNRCTQKYIIDINEKHAITLRPDNNLNEIIRRIEKICENKKRRECIICLKNTKYTLDCAKCSVDLCFDCYLKLVEDGYGIFNCPQCRISISCRSDNESTQETLIKVKNKLKLKKSQLIVKRVK